MNTCNGSTLSSYQIQKPKMALLSTNTNKQTETEPISLELFNHAAANLNAKGEIQLQKYQKYLLNKK